jgi:signal transduction histidine kinase
MMLRSFLLAHKDELIQSCRERVGIRPVPRPTDAELRVGIPLFLEQVIRELDSDATGASTIDAAATSHGGELLKQGFSVSQVVHSYGDVCQSITDLALELAAPIRTEDFRTLNRCLDDAIASAVSEHARQRERVLADQGKARTTEQLGVLAHELRNLTNTALMAFEILRTAHVGVDGSTSAVLGRSLLGLREVINRSLSEVRLTAGIRHTEPIVVVGFLEEVAAAASLDAKSRDIQLTVLPGDPSLVVDADRQILASVVGNLLQNAIKFTRPRGGVLLRPGATADRVFVEVEDECGGLPEAGIEDLFRVYDQRSSERSGLGLGLAISRQGAHACGGEIRTRNVPGTGCVFVVDLPRVLR